MKKKILSLALALTMCLGLTLPTFAEETLTETFKGITCTVNSNGTISYTGTGPFTEDHLVLGVQELWMAIEIATGVMPGAAREPDVVTISFEPGITGVPDKSEFADYFAAYGWSSVTVNYDSGSDSTVQPTTPTQPVGATASPTNDKLEVNGAAADPTVYKINGSNYFKIRDVAALLNGTSKQADVGYDSATNSVTLTTGRGYAKQSGDLAGAAKGGDQSAAASNDAIYVNGQKIEAEVYKIGGSNYFKLRDLGKALNFYVGWTAERGMFIETDKPYSE